MALEIDRLALTNRVNTSFTSVRSEVGLVAVYAGKVGAERTAELCLSTPPSKPGGPGSEHRAFQGVTFQAWDFSQVGHLRRVRCRPSAPTGQPVGPNSRALGSY